MKNFLFLTLFIFGMNAMANNYVESLQALSWDELVAHEDVDFEGVQINFSGRLISRLDVCLSDASTLRTKTKRDIEEYDGEDFYTVGYDYLYTSLNYTSVMVDGDGTIDLPAKYAITKDVRVVQMDDDFEGDLLFKKSHTIESCSTL